MNKIYTFPNGLKLALCPMEHTRSIAIGVFVGVGAANETKERSGIAHFTEHMLFKGTEKRTAFDIANEMESLGVMINAFTARHMTCYYTMSTDEHTEHCMDVLSDILFNSKLADEEIDRERKVILEEISRDEDDPEDVCNEGLASVFYGDNFMGRPILGSRENVQNFSSNDVRDFMSDFYVPNNTVVSIAGNFEIERIIALVDQFFASKFTEEKDIGELDKISTNSAYFNKTKDIEQANISFAFPSYTFNNPKRDAVSLISNVFGGGMSSRLFQNVREKNGLAYDVYSIVSANVNVGAFSIYLGTNPKNASKATYAVKEEIDKLKKYGITDAEFNKGIQQLKSNLVLGSESSLSLMRANGRNMIMEGKMFDVSERLNAINSLTQMDIKEAIEFIFNYENVSASYVGPKTNVNVFGIIKGENDE
ncbi:MAG: insulinase family protein [Clostridia bacterium]|nr:insulinase family protein [Clostridia bacterium]